MRAVIRQSTGIAQCPNAGLTHFYLKLGPPYKGWLSGEYYFLCLYLLMLTIINTQWCIIKEVTILGRDMREGNNNFGGASNNGIGGRIEARNQQHFVSDSELHRLR